MVYSTVRYQVQDNVSTGSSDDALLDDNEPDTMPLINNPTYSRTNNRITFNQHEITETPEATEEGNNQNQTSYAYNAYRKYMLDRISHNLFVVNLIALSQLAILILALFDINGQPVTSPKLFNINMNCFYWYSWTLIILNFIFSGIPILICLAIICNFISYDRSFRLIHMNTIIFHMGFLPRLILAALVISNLIGNHPIMIISNSTIQNNLNHDNYEVFIPNYLQYIFLDWIIYAMIFVYCGYINGVLSVINFQAFH